MRNFADTVRSYVDINCVDMVGHSMGCHLILCYLAGLKKQGAPIEWNQGRRYANVGTVVLIDGAMKGLRAISPEYDEWLPNHDVRYDDDRCLRWVEASTTDQARLAIVIL